MSKAAWIFVVLFVAADVIIGLRLFRSPTSRVIKRFATLAELVSMSKPDSPVAMAFKAQTLQDCFTNPAELRTPLYGLGGALTPADIASQTMAARAQCTRLALHFRDYRIAFPSRDEARVTVTARLDGSLQTGEKIDEIRELQCELVRADGVWRFRACTAEEVLQK